MTNPKSNQSQPLSYKEFADLQFLMDKYCRKKQEMGHCDDFTCAYCDIRKAYDEIFYTPNEIQWDEELFVFGDEKIDD
jgi:hypothetical protein